MFLIPSHHSFYDNITGCGKILTYILVKFIHYDHPILSFINPYPLDKGCLVAAVIPCLLIEMQSLRFL